MKTEAIPQIEDVMDAVKARFVATALNNQFDMSGDVASLMTGTPLHGDPTNTLIDLISYAHGLHAGAKTHRQLGNIRQADNFEELGQLLLRLAGISAAGWLAALAQLTVELGEHGVRQ